VHALTKSHKPAREDVDLPTLGRALWHANGWILGLAFGAGLVTFVALSMVRPLYTSESCILIQNDESAFTRPTSEEGRDPRQTLLDEQAVQSQVQVLTSPDLALDVVKALDLPNNPEFAKDEGVSLFKRILNRIGLGRGSPKSEEEKAANTFADNLEVFQLAKSSVIALEYTSGDSPLAAKISNQLADSYIEWQRKEKLEQTKDATAWLSDLLRKQVADFEAAAEQFRSSQGLYAGRLNAQQLSELNSQRILAKAQRSEVEARARLIQKMIDDGGDIDATPEVLKSELIGRLIEQRVQVQRELAQLSATLMPSHPRLKQLNSELADVRNQIRDEATKIVKGLKNEAEVASARETSLRNSLNDTKAQASGQSDAEIKLRVLEREAKANRDLLESYLVRHDMGPVPAQAAIVSRARASILPSFPKRGPLSLLVMAATALLALCYVVARELIGAPAESRGARRPSEPEVKARRVPMMPPVAAQARPPRAPMLAGEQSAAGLLDRLRQGLSAGQAEAKKEEAEAAPGLLARLRRALPGGDDTTEQADKAKGTRISTVANSEETIPPLRPNDLRHYLNQRIASSTSMRVDEPAENATLSAPKVGKGKMGPALKSLDGVINHILAASKANAPRAVLVAGVMPNVDATQGAIKIARSLVARREQVVLVDLTCGASAVSGPLGLPRAPGFTDLAAGRSSFDEVIRVDSDTSLQVITAGNPAVKGSGEEVDRFMRVFEALTEAYDCVVLHADGDSVRRLTPALKFEVPIAVVVLPLGATAESEARELADFAALGCQVVVYEKTGKDGRTGLLGRVAAI
jgi:uncharacterized protein involved in exopolysaccharide biosynthesis/Mrp family chromosome partitioning ATPase